jgi:hypothetical protein
MLFLQHKTNASFPQAAIQILIPHLIVSQMQLKSIIRSKADKVEEIMEKEEMIIFQRVMKILNKSLSIHRFRTEMFLKNDLKWICKT